MDVPKFLTKLRIRRPRWEYRDALLLLVLVAVTAVWLWPIGSSFRKTNRDMDVAIFGDGYFQLLHGSDTWYTRKGSLKLNNNGEVYFANAGEQLRLEPAITLPQDMVGLHVHQTGLVSVEQFGVDQASQLGTLQLVRFMNPSGLKEISPGFFVATQESGQPIVSEPTKDGTGSVHQRWLEGSSLFANADSTSALLAILCGCIAWLFLEVRVLRRQLATAELSANVTMPADADARAVTLAFPEAQRRAA